MDEEESEYYNNKQLRKVEEELKHTIHKLSHLVKADQLEAIEDVRVDAGKGRGGHRAAGLVRCSSSLSPRLTLKHFLNTGRIRPRPSKASTVKVL